MIQHAHFHQCQGFHDPLSNIFVLLADFRRTGRMVMSNDDHCGIVLEGQFNNFAGMYLGLAERAGKKYFSLQ